MTAGRFAWARPVWAALQRVLLASALATTTSALASAAAPWAPGQTLRVCDDVNEWPPYTYFERVNGRPSERVTGFTVELLRRIADRHGVRVQVDMLPWKRCLEAVRTGEVLLLLNAIRTPERERDYWLSAPIYDTRLLVLWSHRTRPEGLALRTQADLLPLRIGALQGYSYSQLDLVPDGRLVRAPNYHSLLQMLHLGRVDVALVNEGVMLGHAALGNPAFSGDKDLRIGALSDREPSRFYMMATRAKPEGKALIALINQELDALDRQGELNRLRDVFLRPLALSPAPGKRPAPAAVGTR